MALLFWIAGVFALFVIAVTIASLVRSSQLNREEDAYWDKFLDDDNHRTRIHLPGECE